MSTTTATPAPIRERRFAAPDGGAADDVLFYVQEFARNRFRGQAHLDSDFRRFATAYRIAPAERRRVRRMLELLYEGGCGR